MSKQPDKWGNISKYTVTFVFAFYGAVIIRERSNVACEQALIFVLIIDVPRAARGSHFSCWLASLAGS